MVLRQFIEDDLRRWKRLKMRALAEIDRQLRLATPTGDHLVAFTLPSSLAERQEFYGLLGDLLALKLAIGFVLVSEVERPDGLMATCVHQQGSMVCRCNFDDDGAAPALDEIEWLPQESVEGEIRALLPKGRRELSSQRLAQLEAMFGPRGRFPVIEIAQGKLGIM